MSNLYLERAEAIRNDPAVHYNCAQAVVLTFAPECGLTKEQAAGVTAHFGSGMKMAATCGAITGGLMVIGLLGGGDDVYRSFMAGMRGKHEGLTDCAALLRRNAEQGGQKKPHCDGMVYDAVELIAGLMANKLN